MDFYAIKSNTRGAEMNRSLTFFEAFLRAHLTNAPTYHILMS